jgi:hypothetical protein
MHPGLLTKYFGTDRQWRGPCVVILDAAAAIQSTGADSIVHSGAKVYAPRLISGRVAADAVCLLPDEAALLVVQSQRIRQATGEDLQQQTLTVVALQHVAGLEFADLGPLKAFGVAAPTIKS